MRKIEYYLVSTSHLTDRLWFRNDEDFKVGMNHVATLAASSCVKILCFILMSNHVHFVMVGQLDEVERFITEYKRRYSSYYSHKYGTREFLRRNDVDISRIELEDEALERTIAYVQMNSVAANICANASFYPWGTGCAFFNGNPPQGKTASEYTGNALMHLLHSRVSLPGHFRILEAGYVDPASYVSVQTVEHLFRTPARMNYFLNSSSKAKSRLTESALPSFRDQTILSSIPDLCHTLFRKNALSELTENQQGELLRQLRYRFSADINQLCRVLGISYEEAVRFLDKC